MFCLYYFLGCIDNKVKWYAPIIDGFPNIILPFCDSTGRIFYHKKVIITIRCRMSFCMRAEEDNFLRLVVCDNLVYYCLDVCGNRLDHNNSIERRYMLVNEMKRKKCIAQNLTGAGYRSSGHSLSQGATLQSTHTYLVKYFPPR